MQSEGSWQGVVRRVLRLNRQAVEAMGRGYFAVAERIFIVCQNLLEDTGSQQVEQMSQGAGFQ